jgi:HD-GYP domain-containing protein (c-di-GMP phosphodiesterase class II)
MINSILKRYCLYLVLHDIGKVHVKKDIIEKNTELIAEEFKEMQSHTIAGAAYIKKVIILFNRIQDIHNISTFS